LNIRSAPDERDFYKQKSLHFEKLKGSNDRSMRLNDQYRLILRLEPNGDTKTAVIVSVTDYH
jgi:proteic killer suppression protein